MIDRANPDAAGERYMLGIFVGGLTPKSIAAIANLKRLCETHVPGQYEIEVVDLLKNPALAKADQVVAIPTLVRRLPPPLRRVIGDLSKAERVLVALDVQPLKNAGGDGR
jgi:circadian clock protein KaiB